MSIKHETEKAISAAGAKLLEATAFAVAPGGPPIERSSHLFHATVYQKKLEDRKLQTPLTEQDEQIMQAREDFFRLLFKNRINPPRKFGNDVADIHPALDLDRLTWKEQDLSLRLRLLLMGYALVEQAENLISPLPRPEENKRLYVLLQQVADGINRNTREGKLIIEDWTPAFDEHKKGIAAFFTDGYFPLGALYPGHKGNETVNGVLFKPIHYLDGIRSTNSHGDIHPIFAPLHPKMT